MPRITRRQFIGAAAGLTLAASVPALPVRALAINPRASWALDRPPKGPLDSEDVKFLLVHHSASRNGHTGADAPGILRSFYDYHTGPKGWNDIAYNFLIDADGGVWEGRFGSLDGPVAGDATGGNQGFTQLVCIIGDYNTAQPTQASLLSLTHLLAWLADRYSISTAPGAEVIFTSRGSNKWAAGTEVTTPTITGHRTMSKTTCPGDNLYEYVAGGLTADVEAVRAGVSPTPSTTPPPVVAPVSTTTTTRPPATTTSTAPAPATTLPPSTTTTSFTTRSVTTSSAPSTTSPSPSVMSPTSTISVAPSVPQAAGSDVTYPWLPAGAFLLAVGVGLLSWRFRRMSEGE